MAERKVYRVSGYLVEVHEPHALDICVANLAGERDAALKSAAEATERAEATREHSALQAQSYARLESAAREAVEWFVLDGSVGMAEDAMGPLIDLVGRPVDSNPPAVATSERPIVVGSTWRFLGYPDQPADIEPLREITLYLPPKPGLANVSTKRKGRPIGGGDWSEGEFRKLHEWLSDPPVASKPGSEET